MKSLLAIIVLMVTFNALPVFADETALPEIAPVDVPAPPALDAPAAE